MCGIVGTVCIDSSIEAKSQSLETLKHRGPDAEGQWSSVAKQVWLGHQRLAIVDLSDAGRQPMSNEDKSLWLVCNGEIYNYPTLRTRLEGLGHQFYSNSDSEVILHAYEAWGVQCVDYLEGMFAFILWDDKQQRLFAARDRVGIKPLYYAKTGQGLLLASEARALLPLLETEAEPEPMALAYVMTLGYIPAPWSIWREIHKLEAGHFLTWQPHLGMQTQCYWEPPQHIEAKEDETSWKALFESVLNEHLLADVPIGLFLSGGLDSSSVAVGLRDLGQSVEAITISFPDSPYNEERIATDVAKQLEFPHRIVPIESIDVNHLIKQVAKIYDEPQSYSALLSMVQVSQVAAQNFKVVLAGDGGDEVFGGYIWYQHLNHSLLSMRGIARLVRSMIRGAVPGERAFVNRSPLHRHAWRLHPRFLPAEAQRLLSPTGLRFGETEMLAPLRKHFKQDLPLKRALQRVDLMTFCSDSILAKVDRASMAYSLEVRVPFLDRRIVEWAISRPLTEREEKSAKPILRDYLSCRVPASVLTQPKSGFSLRVLDRFDWDAAVDQIRQGPWVQKGYWSPDWKRLLEMDVPYRSARIWNLLMLTRWAEVWLK